MYTKLLSVLLVSLLVLSPIAVADARGLTFQNKSHDDVSLGTLSKKDHKDNSVKVDDRDDDDEDDEDNRSPPPGSIYSVNATGEATTKPKGHGNADKKDKDNEGKGKDKGKGKNSEVEDASLNLRAEVEKSSKGRIKLKILSGTLEIGNTKYDIEKGKGKINKKNDNLDFKAKVSSQGKDLELILKGERDGTIPLNLGNAPATVEFTSPQSKLASKWFLDLSGKISIESAAPAPPPPSSGPNRTTLAITKSVNASTVLGKGTLRYLITFMNSGATTATNIEVTDTLPKHVSFVSTNGSIVSMSGSTIRFSAGDLSKEARKSIFIVVGVNATAPDQTALKNNASIVWKNKDNTIGGPVTAMAMTTVLAPSLQMTKSVNASVASPGSALLYTIRINNTGGATGRINLTDTRPANTTLVSPSLAPNSITGRTLTWLLSLASGGTITVTIEVRVNSTIGPQTLTNVAVVNYKNDKDAVFPAVSAQASTGISTVALMTLQKSVNVTTALGGDTLKYVLTYKNIGNGIARESSITDNLPSATTLVSTNGTISSMVGKTIKFSLGDVSSSSGGAIEILVRIDAMTPDQRVLKNNATLEWKNPDNSIVTVDSTALTTVLAPSLQMLKSVNASVTIPGRVLLYTIRVNNSGSAVANLNLTDTLPANVTLLSTSLAPNSVAGRILTWALSLSGGGQLLITITVQVNGTIGPQTLTNMVVVNYKNDKGIIFPTVSSQASTSISAIVIMSLQKSVNATSTLGGSGLRYILSFANTGNGTATSVNITDTLPGYTTFVSTNGTGVSISGHTITFTLGNISASSGGKIAIIVKVNGTTPDQTILRNNVTLRWKNPSGSVAMVNATASTTINAPVLVIMKSVNATTANAGHHLFYNITIINNGHADAIITLNDTLPAGVTVNSTSMAPNIISGTSYIWNTLTLAPGGKATITILVKVSIGTLGTITNKAIATYRNVNDIEFPQVSDQKSTLIAAP